MPIYGNGKNVRGWIHVSDHVNGVQTVLERGIPGEIYNIGTESHLSNNDLATMIINLMGLNGNMKSVVEDRKGHDFRYSVDSSKIMSLGFQNKIELKVGLEETIKWYLDN